MLIIDSLLVGGIKFALGKVAAAVEEQLNDDSVHRDRLLDAQMRLELGEITDEEFAEVERDVMRALREIKERREGPQETGIVLGGDVAVVGASAEFLGDEHEPVEIVAAETAPPEPPKKKRAKKRR